MEQMRNRIMELERINSFNKQKNLSLQEDSRKLIEQNIRLYRETYDELDEECENSKHILNEELYKYDELIFNLEDYIGKLEESNDNYRNFINKLIS